MKSVHGAVLTALALAALLPDPASAYVGRFRSFSDTRSVNVLVEHKGKVYAGTQGGIRVIEPSGFEETQFTNEDGLRDSRIVAMAADPQGRLWAASRSGELYRLEGKKWSAWGRSYRAEGWTINLHAMIAVGNYLVLGSEKGLSFFDWRDGIAAVNLVKFGREGAQSITGLLRKGDSLYVATGKTVLKAPVDWSNVVSSKYGTIFDPQIWVPAEGVTGLTDAYVSLRKGAAAAGAARIRGRASGDTSTPNDTIIPPIDTTDNPPVDTTDNPPVDTTDNPPVDTTDNPPIDTTPPDTTTAVDTTQNRPVRLAFLDGKIVAHDTGTVLVSPIRVKALRGRSLIIDGSKVENLKTYLAAAAVGKTVFVGGETGMFAYDEFNVSTNLAPPNSYPEERVAAVATNGKAVDVITARGIYRLRDSRWQLSYTWGFTWTENVQNELRNIDIDDAGRTLLGTWGRGLFRHSPSGEVETQWYNLNTCMPATLPPDFTVVHRMSDIRGESVWLTQLKNPTLGDVQTHHLAYLNVRTGKVWCPDFEGPSLHTQAIRILSDGYFGVAGDKGIFIYKWGRQGDSATAAPPIPVQSGVGSDQGRDLALDGHGRLWVLLNDRLGYVNGFDSLAAAGTALRVTFLENASMTSCRVMEKDALDALWIGCENGLFQLRPAADSAQESALTRYSMDDGLLSDRVVDVAVDERLGWIWIVTDNGISLFESESQAPVTGVGAVKAYPNPFTARHDLLVIDNLPTGATAAIYTQGGNVIRRFHAADRRGNQFQWDGRNRGGRKVTPGVYFYSVEAGGKSTRGKLIVAR